MLQEYGMHYLSFLALFNTFVTLRTANATIFGWIWDKLPDRESKVPISDGVPLISIPYESMTEDEKFLQEAAKFTEVQISSFLDTCQHKVVMKIKTSCNDLSEEDLAKLSVNLLNCQSSVEGRKIFPCTEEMSLKQCTIDMDADVWNAYHLMSNRARAVCYAARNVQFRALTELTVNKLVQAAHSQIHALDSLKDSQDRLEKQTLEALSSVVIGHKELLEQQSHLKDAQTTAYNLVSTNLRELTAEKALIRSGHAELASMTESIKNKLEVTIEDIQRQESERQDNHQELLKDLSKIQEAVHEHKRILGQLRQINETINYIWNLTNMMHAEVDEKLCWITHYIDSTGLQMQKTYTIFLHVVFMMSAMIVAGFLQAPFLTRVTIIAIIPLNLFSYLKHGSDASLDFLSITSLIILITMMHYVVSAIQCIFGVKAMPLYKVYESMDQSNTTMQNGHISADHVNRHSINSSRDCSRMIQGLFHGKIFAIIYSVWNSIAHHVVRVADNIKGNIVNFFATLCAWMKYSKFQQEELSCSYMPKKVYESCVSNISDDLDDDLMDYDDGNFKNLNPIVKRTESTDMRYRPILSKSGTMDAKVCLQITRNGTPCRGRVMKNEIYCYKHS